MNEKKYYYCIAMLMMLCFFSSILHASDIKEFWMLPNNEIKVWVIVHGYPRPSHLPPLGICHFTIDGECDGKFYQKKRHIKVVMNGEQQACIESGDLIPGSEYYKKYIRISYAEAYQKELTPISSALEEQGISIGQKLWLKLPVEDIPGLSSVSVIDIKHAKEEWKPEIYILKISDGNREAQIKLESYIDLSKSLSDIFSKSNPGQKWGKRVLSAIRKNKIFIGMKKDQVIASWGKPYMINTTHTMKGSREQWVMNDSFSSDYLYFEGSTLVSMQQSKRGK